jgi:excisionase family DNA binding protein
MPPDGFLTVAEVASILKVNQETVRNWIDVGKLPAVHVGRRVRIRRADFDALLDASVIGNRAAGPGRTSWMARSRRPRCRPRDEPFPLTVPSITAVIVQMD